jgi:hypothetical protein
LDGEREWVIVGKEARATFIQMDIATNDLAEFVEGNSDFLSCDFVRGFQC